MKFEPLERRHAARVFDDLQDPALYAYILEPRPGSLAQLEARYAQLAAGSGRVHERWLNWIAFDGETPVGTLQATVYPDHRAEVAWVIFPRYWRRGFGTLAVAWLLQQLGDVVLAEATIDPRNAASLALATKLGFQRVGTRGDDMLVAHRIRDPDAIIAEWAAARVRAIAAKYDDFRGGEKCRLVPRLGEAAASDERALVLLGDALVDPDYWADNNPHSPGGENVRDLATNALGALGPRAEAALAAALGHPARARSIVDALARLPSLSTTTLSAVERVAADYEASYAVGALLAKHGVDCEPLIADPATRTAGIAGSPALDVHRLVELLGDPSVRVRVKVLNRLSGMKPLPEPAIAAVIACLGDRSRDVARAAAAALEHQASDEPRITRALFDATQTTPFGRYDATVPLASRPPAQLATLIPELIAWLACDGDAAIVLGALGTHATPDVIAALETSAKSWRNGFNRAQRALEEIADARQATKNA